MLQAYSWPPSALSAAHIESADRGTTVLRWSKDPAGALVGMILASVVLGPAAGNEP